MSDPNISATSRQPQIPAIPTVYKGIRFRSRLEANWAAFFDELKIEWEYEPLDLNGYIPDFLIRIPGAAGYPNQCLIEVKPATSLNELREWAQEYADKGGGFELLFVGVGPFPSRYVDDANPTWGKDHILGIFGPVRHDLIDASWFCDGFNDLSTTCSTIGGESHWSGIDVAEYWAKAKNAVQWRRPA